MDEVIIREATGEDFTEIHSLIVKRAEELMLATNDVADVSKLVRDYYSKPAKFCCLVCETDARVIGYAIYTHGYCVFLGRSISMEELYIIPEYREEAQLPLFKRIVEITNNLGYQRLAWLSSKNSSEMHEFWIKNEAIVYSEEEGYLHYQLDVSTIQERHCLATE